MEITAVTGSLLDGNQYTAFKTVLLEGIEVVFIVVAIGAGGTLIGPAAVGAAIALVVVVVLGLVLHRPLAALPENKLKFGVGVLLSAFGIFWVGEGIGLSWPRGTGPSSASRPSSWQLRCSSCRCVPVCA